uniref:Neuropeptide Y prohormone-2 n=1 Tax=Schmidtea mediterranea TaxID=79327 RepID=E3CTJ4_SCHMD|nr:TPA_inf: neuropeptide Y prohormone-2 [Schmidtea mediterranea]
MNFPIISIVALLTVFNCFSAMEDDTKSLAELKNLLSDLNEEYLIAGRPRFGKRNMIFKRSANPLKWMTL